MDQDATWYGGRPWPRRHCGQKEAQVQLYLLGGANVPSWEGTLAPPGEYD